MVAAWCSLCVALAASGAVPPVAEHPVDDRGVLASFQIGPTVFLQNVGVNIVAPKWQGSLGSQLQAKADAVQKDRTADATVYHGVLQSASLRTQLRQTVHETPGGLRIEYELTPQTDAAVEAVLCHADIPLSPHRGATRYSLVQEENVQSGVFPAELNAAQYRFLSSPDAKWLALVRPDGAAVRIKLENLAIAIQDSRKFRGSSYELQASVRNVKKLVAGKPLRFAIEITATTADEVAAAEKKTLTGTFQGVVLSSQQALHVGSVRVSRQETPVYEHVELTPDIAARFDNPFDPDDVAVDAEIKMPDGRTVRVPAFYDVPCQLLTTSDKERIRPTGEPPRWTIRFTPTIAGRHVAVVHVRDRSGQAKSSPVAFEAVASQRRGFIRVAQPNNQYFQFDGGKSYFPVGENICWAHASKPLAEYQSWFNGLAAQGGNWARLWLATSEKGLEWMPSPTARPGLGVYLGLGRYSIENSWRLDQVVRMAEGSGVRLMFCIGTFGEIKADADYFNANLWESNPYNKINGGPCASPKEFFTNAKARKLYERRLRYIVARWGYSPNVFAWEFWNEYTAPADWIAEMAAFLRQHDVNRHLVSTTYGTPEVWKNPDVDFVMTHHYGDSGSILDFGSLFDHHTRENRRFDKPFFIAEFGIDWRTSDAKYDPEGRGQNLHNGLWSGVMAGGAGTPMLWYWDDYVDRKNVYPVFKPVSQFVNAIDWPRHRFMPIDGMKITLHSDEPERFEDLDFSMSGAWDDALKGTYRVGRDGRIDGGLIAGVLGGPHKKGLLHADVFELDMPADGRFTIGLGTVSSRARLQISVDDKVQLDEVLRAGPPGQGPWKASRFMSQWKIWQADYDRDVTVRVPAGRHTVRVANADGDWLSLHGGRVTNYRSSRYPSVFALGLQSPEVCVLWLQDQHSTWKAVRDKITLHPQIGLQVTIPSVSSGVYRVAWWNTYTGEIVKQSDATATDAGLTLDVPSFMQDIAAVIRRVP